MFRPKGSHSDATLLRTSLPGLRWNVKGTLLYSVHEWFEAQDEALDDAIDTRGDRIRSLRPATPRTLQELMGGRFCTIRQLRPTRRPESTDDCADCERGVRRTESDD